MKGKSKGSAAERELVHMFNDSQVWAAIRIAGSGLTSDPNPDVLSGNGKRYLAIECKSTKDTKYLSDGDIKQILDFSSKFGAEPWFGIKFNNRGWFFLKPSDLAKSKGDSYSVSLLLAKEKGLSFEQLINLKNGDRIL